MTRTRSHACYCFPSNLPGWVISATAETFFACCLDCLIFSHLLDDGSSPNYPPSYTEGRELTKRSYFGFMLMGVQQTIFHHLQEDWFHYTNPFVKLVTGYHQTNDRHLLSEEDTPNTILHHLLQVGCSPNVHLYIYRTIRIRKQFLTICKLDEKNPLNVSSSTC